MLERWESLTKKYAQAYLNLYGSTLTNDMINKLEAFEQFIRHHKRMYAFMCLTGIPVANKKEILNKITMHFKVPTNIEKLIETLLLHRRIDLLAPILKKIVQGYKKQQNVTTFKVSTSHPIGQKEKEIIQNFIQNSIKKSTLALEFYHDVSLISGIKIQSDSLLWERSVAKQLKLIKREALQQVYL